MIKTNINKLTNELDNTKFKLDNIQLNTVVTTPNITISTSSEHVDANGNPIGEATRVYSLQDSKSIMSKLDADIGKVTTMSYFWIKPDNTRINSGRMVITTSSMKGRYEGFAVDSYNNLSKPVYVII